MTDILNAIHPFLAPVGRLMLAALLGSLLGLEREWHRRSAGLRTNTLIALGSAAFTLVSIELAARQGTGDATRIPAMIVSGIGFLGGGAILRTRSGVRGLTTAAAIWVNAAIGMAAGAGLVVLAISVTLTALLVLTVLKRVENRMDRYRPQRRDKGQSLDERSAEN